MQHIGSYRPLRFLIGLAAATLIAACGGGGNGGGGYGGGGTPAPSGLSYPTAPAFVVGHAISSLSPTVTGTVTAYSVSPALPAGLSVSVGTGVISGTPTAVTSAASYTVEAGNSGGSTTAMIVLTVNAAGPAISYGGTNFVFTTQAPIHLPPTNNGGSVVTWSISGSLPAGLTFSTTDGSIAGTPTAAAAAASYVVTAENSGGQSKVSLTLAVQSVLLNLGNTGGIDHIRLANSRVLSLAGSSWVLWNAGTAAVVATGAEACLTPPTELFPACATEPLADIAGSIVIVETKAAFEMRSASDGSLMATLSVPAGVTWWRLATDGSYLSAGGPSGLTVWLPNGTVAVSRTGDYSSAITFAAPGAVQVGLGPAGASVIETISVPSGSSSTGPTFQGQFNSWFEDGGQFLTNTGNTVWVYSASATQEDIKALPTITSLTGQGSWFWTNDGTVTVYKVGASGSPAGTFSVGSLTPAIPSGMTIGALEVALVGSPTTVAGVVHIIDLSGASPVMVDHATPAYDNTAYAATSSSQWLVGNANGTLLDGSSLGGTLRYFGFGAALSIAGSAQRVAVSTAIGKTLFFNVTTGALEGSIDSPNFTGFPGSQIALSADGSVLIAGSTGDGGAVQVYSLPSGTLTYSWPAATFLSFALSDSGTALGQILESCVAGSCTATRQVTAPTGGAVIWSDTNNPNTVQPIRLSPDGTLIAVSSIAAGVASTNIYRNGVLVTALPGWAVSWLDNTHLLVQNSGGVTGSGPGAASTSSVIVDPSGTTLSTPTPHDFEDPFQVVGPDSIYVLKQNSIFSVSTGAPTWSTLSPSSGVGAVAGSYVVFVSGNQVISQPF
jgi:Putative Ig domain